MAPVPPESAPASAPDPAEPDRAAARRPGSGRPVPEDTSTPPPADWAPDSWRRREARQQPTYPDAAALERALAQLRTLPPLVTSWEVESLREQLAEAAEGRRFVLQGGDCAERFDECTSEQIAGKLKILLQMSLVLVHGGRKPVVRIGRFAGQYAKPRSSDVETRDGVELPSYRGDNVNAIEFDAASRTPDPDRLVRGHAKAALALNFIRALVEGGFADLHHPEYWNLDFVGHSPHADAYRRITAAIGEAIDFLETITGTAVSDVGRVEFFTSHEALHLPLEEAMTRGVPRRAGIFNLGTHLPWIGLRTADPEGAHVEYARGIANPIGVKVGPGVDADALRRLVDRIDPARVPGRLVLISRFGAHGIAEGLPPLVDAMRREGRRPAWIADPMHGNTEATAEGLKTRKFEHILAELEQAFEIHRAAGSHLAGVHFELTGDDVTECTGGARGLADADLRRAYRTQVDPRLNSEQALEMALRIARRLAEDDGRG